MKHIQKLSLITLLIFNFSFADYFTKKIAEDVKGCSCTKKLAIQSVSMIDGSTNVLTSLYYLRLATEFSGSPISIIDRNQIEASLNELALAQSGLVSDSESTPKTGNFVAADALLHLTIAELEEGTEIFFQLIQVETGVAILSRAYSDFQQTTAATSQSMTPSQTSSIYIPATEIEKKSKISYDFRNSNPKEIKNFTTLRKEYSANENLFAAQKNTEQVNLIFKNPKTAIPFIHIYAKKNNLYQQRFRQFLDSSRQDNVQTVKENSKISLSLNRMVNEHDTYFQSPLGKKVVFDNTERFINFYKLRNSSPKEPDRFNNQRSNDKRSSQDNSTANRPNKVRDDRSQQKR